MNSIQVIEKKLEELEIIQNDDTVSTKEMLRRNIDGDHLLLSQLLLEIKRNEWSNPPSAFVPNQEHWCYACNCFDGKATIPMVGDYLEECKKCSYLKGQL